MNNFLVAYTCTYMRIIEKILENTKQETEQEMQLLQLKQKYKTK